MNTVSTRELFRSLCIALVVLLALATLARAEDKAVPADQPPAAADQPAPAVAPAQDGKSELRRLDAAPDAKPDEASMASDQNKDADENKPADPAKKKKRSRMTDGWDARSRNNEVVSVGHDSHLAKGEKADAVVSVFGSSTAEGDVSDAVVSVLGNTRATGMVGDTAVAVLGNTYVNGHVHGEVVAVGGDVELGPNAVVDGEIVSVGGTVLKDPSAVTNGEVHIVSIGGGLSHMDGLKAWLYECALRGRLLGFGPNLAWAWLVALGFLGFYILLALLFRDGVEKCEQTFESRPGYSILTALLSVLTAPIVTVLLAITGVGLIIVPFLVAGIVFATLFGKAVMLAWLGRRFIRILGPVHPALAVLVGGVVVLMLYLVPVLGIIIFQLLGWVGMGVVIYTLIQGMKREKIPAVGVLPVPMAATSVPPVMAASAAAAPMVADPLPAVPLAPPLISTVPLVASTPAALSAALLTRAGFWHRLAALLIDVILVGVIISVGGRHGGLVLPGLAAYGAVMWKLKGTTIGGIICGLQVVRLDGRPIDWPTAIVRALACFLSLAICFLGFIWVAFDPDKQSWHDKIAGTVVVKAPKGTALV
jgi:uncharacterized RDD family membrane protein YckC